MTTWYDCGYNTANLATFNYSKSTSNNECTAETDEIAHRRMKIALSTYSIKESMKQALKRLNGEVKRQLLWRYNFTSIPYNIFLSSNFTERGGICSLT